MAFCDGVTPTFSAGDEIEHICGVVGVAGVIGVLGILFGVDTRMDAGLSSLPLNSRERFGTRPYRTANCQWIKWRKIKLKSH